MESSTRKFDTWPVLKWKLLLLRSVSRPFSRVKLVHSAKYNAYDKVYCSASVAFRYWSVKSSTSKVGVSENKKFI